MLKETFLKARNIPQMPETQRKKCSNWAQLA